MIVVALQRLDHGGGAPVTAIAELLHVNPIFVMTQSGLLEGPCSADRGKR
jgi:hypothetical protein